MDGAPKAFVPEPGRAGAIARRLCATSLAWAKTIALSVRRSSRELEGALLEEILAYSLCLMNLRLSDAPPAEREAFLALVKHECAALQERRSWRGRNRRRRLPAQGGAPGTASSREQSLVTRPEPEWQSRLTPELFEQFCRATGLSSSVLVGGGQNLASLVFYIALHGVLSARAPLTAEQVQNLLRAARKCRLHLDKLIACELASEIRIALPG